MQGEGEKPLEWLIHNLNNIKHPQKTYPDDTKKTSKGRSINIIRIIGRLEKKVIVDNSCRQQY